jgi:ribonuclease HI
VSGRPQGRRRPRRKGRARSDGERRQLARTARHPAPPPPGPSADGWARLLCDGGSRGNPGPAAVAAVLVAPGGEVLGSRSELIGQATAAEAEYGAILLGLQLATATGIDPVEVRSDSRIAIAALADDAPATGAPPALADAIRAAAGGFSAVRWLWHPRGENELADALVRGLLWPPR